DRLGFDGVQSQCCIGTASGFQDCYRATSCRRHASHASNNGNTRCDSNDCDPVPVASPTAKPAKPNGDYSNSHFSARADLHSGTVCCCFCTRGFFCTCGSSP